MLWLSVRLNAANMASVALLAFYPLLRCIA